MTYAEFCQEANISKMEIYQESFAAQKSIGRDTIRIKKEKTAVKNLDSIFGAVLKISNKKGFKSMSMRDLSRECGLSMGALYNYFSSKDELLEMLQHQRRAITGKILEERIVSESTPPGKLKAAIFTHLYLSEAMQPWFYFSFMETKNLSPIEKQKAIESELATEKMICDILIQGQEQNVFNSHDPLLGASMIKAMLQDWYLKRGKYAGKKISVDQYATYLMEFIEAFFMKADQCPFD
ncbi:MAG: TetR/AcrR family transcriptional regulator [Deltaproteobacteria bacterium]|nr:TetR/AcrR family transcriptional regulator [Deltaproteobacteria bacterium]